MKIRCTFQSKYCERTDCMNVQTQRFFCKEITITNIVFGKLIPDKLHYPCATPLPISEKDDKVSLSKFTVTSKTSA